MGTIDGLHKFRQGTRGYRCLARFRRGSLGHHNIHIGMRFWLTCLLIVEFAQTWSSASIPAAQHPPSVSSATPRWASGRDLSRQNVPMQPRFGAPNQAGHAETLQHLATGSLQHLAIGMQIDQTLRGPHVGAPMNPIQHAFLAAQKEEEEAFNRAMSPDSSQGTGASMFEPPVMYPAGTHQANAPAVMYPGMMDGLGMPTPFGFEGMQERPPGEPTMGMMHPFGTSGMTDSDMRDHGTNGEIREASGVQYDASRRATTLSWNDNNNDEVAPKMDGFGASDVTGFGATVPGTFDTEKGLGLEGLGVGGRGLDGLPEFFGASKPLSAEPKRPSEAGLAPPPHRTDAIGNGSGMGLLRYGLSQPQSADSVPAPSASIGLQPFSASKPAQGPDARLSEDTYTHGVPQFGSIRAASPDEKHADGYDMPEAGTETGLSGPVKHSGAQRRQVGPSALQRQRSTSFGGDEEASTAQPLFAPGLELDVSSRGPEIEFKWEVDDQSARHRVPYTPHSTAKLQLLASEAERRGVSEGAQSHDKGSSEVGEASSYEANAQEAMSRTDHATSGTHHEAAPQRAYGFPSLRWGRDKSEVKSDGASASACAEQSDMDGIDWGSSVGGAAVDGDRSSWWIEPVNAGGEAGRGRMPKAAGAVGRTVSRSPDVAEFSALLQDHCELKPAQQAPSPLMQRQTSSDELRKRRVGRPKPAGTRLRKNLQKLLGAPLAGAAVSGPLMLRPSSQRNVMSDDSVPDPSRFVLLEDSEQRSVSPNGAKKRRHSVARGQSGSASKQGEALQEKGDTALAVLDMAVAGKELQAVARKLQVDPELLVNFHKHLQANGNASSIDQSIYGIIMYNSKLHACACAAAVGRSSFEEGEEILRRMEDAGVKPSLFSFNKLMDVVEGAARFGKAGLSHGESVLIRMQAAGVFPDRDTFVRLLSVAAWSAFHGTALAEDGYWVIGQMVNMKMHIDLPVLKLMMRVVAGAAKHGRAKSSDVDKVLEFAAAHTVDMEWFELAMDAIVDLASWGHATLADGEKLLERVQAAGMHPPMRMYEGLMQAVVLASRRENVESAVVRECERILDLVQEGGQRPPQRMFGAVMAVLADEARNGRASVADAMRLMQRMESNYGSDVWARLTSG